MMLSICYFLLPKTVKIEFVAKNNTSPGIKPGTSYQFSETSVWASLRHYLRQSWNKNPDNKACPSKIAQIWLLTLLVTYQIFVFNDFEFKQHADNNV
jgi:hypothetical protein